MTAAGTEPPLRWRVNGCLSTGMLARRPVSDHCGAFADAGCSGSFISKLNDPVTISLRDLAYLMLTISDNVATDVITGVAGLDSINARLRTIGCAQTTVVGDVATMEDGVATILGFSDYAELLSAQRGDLGAAARDRSTDPSRIDRCRALDPAVASCTTARDATRLLASIWSDVAAPPPAGATLRSVMADQVTRRLAAAVPDGGSLAAKSGALFGRIRNEIGVITDPEAEQYAVAVLTRANEPFAGQAAIDSAMAAVVKSALRDLRGR